MVGLDIDTRISNRVREVEVLMEWQRIRSKVREEYLNNLVRLINETDNTDTDETIRIFRQFQHEIINREGKNHPTTIGNTPYKTTTFFE